MVHSAPPRRRRPLMLALLLGVLSFVLAGGLAIVLPILAVGEDGPPRARTARAQGAASRALEQRSVQSVPAAPEPSIATPPAQAPAPERRAVEPPRPAPASERTRAGNHDHTGSHNRTGINDRAGSADRDHNTARAAPTTRASARGRARIRRTRGRHRRTADVVGRHDRARARRGVLPEIRLRQRLDHRVDARRRWASSPVSASSSRASLRTARLPRLRPDSSPAAGSRRCFSRSTPRSAIYELIGQTTAFAARDA